MPSTTIAEFANTADPDEMAHNEPSHLDLQFFLIVIEFSTKASLILQVPNITLAEFANTAEPNEMALNDKDLKHALSRLHIVGVRFWEGPVSQFLFKWIFMQLKT